MIAYTKRARELGFSVVITNPYEVFWYKDKAVVRISITLTFNCIDVVILYIYFLLLL